MKKLLIVLLTSLLSISAIADEKVRESEIKSYKGTFLLIPDIDTFRTKLIIKTTSGEKINLGLKDYYQGSNLEELVNCKSGFYEVRYGAYMKSTSGSAHLGFDAYYYDGGKIVTTFDCDELLWKKTTSNTTY